MQGGDNLQWGARTRLKNRRETSRDEDESSHLVHGRQLAPISTKTTGRCPCNSNRRKHRMNLQKSGSREEREKPRSGHGENRVEYLNLYKSMTPSSHKGEVEFSESSNGRCTGTKVRLKIVWLNGKGENNAKKTNELMMGGS